MKRVLLTVALSVPCIFLASCGSLQSFSGSPAQQVFQHIAQKQNGGTYVGNANSEAGARSMAQKAGYRYYNYYPSTGECFGYN